MTIIIPAYNCSSTLPRTLDSLVQQEDSNFSVVVVDDCSTENLMKIVTEYQDKLNIRCVRSPENQGCGGARQVGIETVGCSDDYITFLDADDALLPQAVHLLNEAATTQADVLCSPFLILDPGAKKTRPFRFYRGGCGVFMTHGKAYRTKFIKENGIYSDKEIRYFFND